MNGNNNKIILAATLLVLSSSSAASTRVDDLVYPILKPHSWNAKKHVIYNTFLGIDQDPIPIISYGYEYDDSYQFITKYDVKEPLEVTQEKALKNLCKKDVKLESVTSTGHFAVTGSGSPFSSELILCPNFIQKAQKVLNDETLIIAIPRRTVIYIGKGSMTEEEKGKFFYLARDTYMDDSFGNALITNLAFEFVNGEATSIIQYMN
ncbi:hypothetical protein [Photobacterium kasasachensis]|uniref:hypothetical protein n=1 Tax=Photobacterium kasasachensis TaxID=2910240 RepID=UPI003D101CEF